MLKNNGSSSGGIIYDGDLIYVVGINEVFDDGTGVDDLALEVVEEEIVRLTQEAELPALLGGDDGSRTAAKTAVIDSGDTGLVVGELLQNLGIGYEGELGLLGDVAVVAVGGGSRVFGAGRRIHMQKGRLGLGFGAGKFTVQACLISLRWGPY